MAVRARPRGDAHCLGGLGLGPSPEADLLGKTTFIEAMLAGADALTLAARCLRDDPLARAREDAPGTQPELRRHRQAGAAVAAACSFLGQRAAGRSGRVTLAPPAARQLRKVDPGVKRRIQAGVELLAVELRPPAATRLVGGSGECRARTGNYRIVNEISDNELVVLVLRMPTVARSMTGSRSPSGASGEPAVL